MRFLFRTKADVNDGVQSNAQCKLFNVNEQFFCNSNVYVLSIKKKLEVMTFLFYLIFGRREKTVFSSSRVSNTEWFEWIKSIGKNLIAGMYSMSSKKIEDSLNEYHCLIHRKLIFIIFSSEDHKLYAEIKRFVQARSHWLVLMIHEPPTENRWENFSSNQSSYR